MSQKMAIPKKPARNALPGFIAIISVTRKETIANDHQGRKYSATADNTAIKMIERKNFML